MKNLTNMIGSFIVAIGIIGFPVIVGMGIAGDWFEREGIEGALIHPWLGMLWILCLVCTIGEIAILTLALATTE